ncbi:MAG: multiple sugar transport system permease protein [Streptosporangiaceae bacterium]|jgi:multiple sugar transport system permease protein|nr:multiple sugar transport system permease protein [Streptosporangiaceae bacterium]
MASTVSFTLTSRRRRRAGRFLATAGLVIGLLFILLPIFWLLETAFQKPRDAFTIPPHFIFLPTLENFRSLVHGQFAGSLLHSVILMTGSTAVALLLGVPAGYALSRSRFRGSRAITAWLIGAYITPALIYIVPLYVIYQQLGLTGSYLSMILYYETFQMPFTIFMTRGYFTDIPRSFDESAWIDGCSRWLAFRKVILPLALPGIATVAILDAIGAWGEYFGALIFSSPSTETAPVAIYQYVGLDVSNWSALAAAALFVVVPIMVLTAVAQRGLVRGITAGGLIG